MHDAFGAACDDVVDVCDDPADDEPVDDDDSCRAEPAVSCRTEPMRFDAADGECDDLGDWSAAGVAGVVEAEALMPKLAVFGSSIRPKLAFSNSTVERSATWLNALIGKTAMHKNIS